MAKKKYAAKVTYLTTVWDGRGKRESGYSFLDENCFDGKYLPDTAKVEKPEKIEEEQEKQKAQEKQEVKTKENSEKKKKEALNELLG